MRGREPSLYHKEIWMSAETSSKWFRYLPNILSLLRILAVPVIVILLYQETTVPEKEQRTLSLISGFFFILASITDYFDGYLARRFNIITPLGRLLDPLADKLLITACLIMFVEMKRVEAWIVIVILTREIGITGLRAFALEEGVQFTTTNWGKYKTVYQIVAISALLFNYKRPFLFFGVVDFFVVGYWFLWVAMILTLYSGIDYVYKFWRALKF